MIANPFTFGDPISEPQRFYGRKREVDQVFSRLCNVEFESSSIVGERRIGKTSLLKYLANPTVRTAYGLDQAEYIFIYMDLQLVGPATTPARLWQRFLQQIGHHCQHAGVKRVLDSLPKADALDNFALSDLFDSVDASDQYIVFLLDEFENITDNPNFGPDFFYGLRSLAIQHNLALVTSSRRELIELCHSEAIRSSPFFNIFANITLRLFTESEARQLMAQSLEGTGVSFTDTEVSAIFRMAGLHPQFLQASGHYLFEGYRRGLSPEERSRFLGQAFFAEAKPHYEEYWRTSGDQEKIVLTALALVARQISTGGLAFDQERLRDLYAHSIQTLAHLATRSLVTPGDLTDGAPYVLFSSAFGEWIIAEVTNTQLDQQSYEEWLRANQVHLDRLSGKTRSQLGELLPRIRAAYRALVINLADDPKKLIPLVELLKKVVGL